MKNIYYLSLLTILLLFFTSEKTRASSEWFKIKSGWQPESLSNISQLKLKLTKNCQTRLPYPDNSGKLSYDIQEYLKDWQIPMVTGETVGSEPYMNVSITCEEAEYHYNNTSREGLNYNYH